MANLSPGRRLRTKTSDLTDFFRGSGSPSSIQARQQDASTTSLEVPSRDKPGLTTTTKKITRLQLFGRSRKKSNHWPAAPSPFSSTVMPDFSNQGQSTERRPSEPAAMLPIPRAALFESECSHSTKTCSTTPRPARPIIMVSLTDNNEEFMDLFARPTDVPLSTTPSNPVTQFPALSSSTSTPQPSGPRKSPRPVPLEKEMVIPLSLRRKTHSGPPSIALRLPPSSPPPSAPLPSAPSLPSPSSIHRGPRTSLIMDEDLDNASADDLRKALKQRHEKCEELSRLIFKIKEVHTAEIIILEKKVAFLEREALRHETQTKGFTWILNDGEAPQQQPKALPPRIPAIVHRLAYQNDSEAESNATSTQGSLRASGTSGTKSMAQISCNKKLGHPSVSENDQNISHTISMRPLPKLPSV